MRTVAPGVVQVPAARGNAFVVDGDAGRVLVDTGMKGGIRAAAGGESVKGARREDEGNVGGIERPAIERELDLQVSGVCMRSHARKCRRDCPRSEAQNRPTSNHQYIQPLISFPRSTPISGWAGASMA